MAKDEIIIDNKPVNRRNRLREWKMGLNDILDAFKEKENLEHAKGLNLNESNIDWPKQSGSRGDVYFLLEESLCLKVSGCPKSYGKVKKEALFLRRLGGLDGVVKLVDDFDLGGDMYALVMEKADMDLAKYIEIGIEPGRYAPIIEQICNSLIDVHTRGVWHRDIKPENMLLFSEGGTGSSDKKLKLCDFTESGFVSTNIETTISIKGTANYLAPEIFNVVGDKDKLEKARDSELAEVYSIGAVIFEMIVGKKLYKDVPLEESNYGQGRLVIDFSPLTLKKEDMQELNQRLKKMDEPIKNKNLPPYLKDIARKCLEKDPSKRYRTITELKNALGFYPKIEKINNDLISALKNAQPEMLEDQGRGEYAAVDIETAKKIAGLKDALDELAIGCGFADYTPIKEIDTRNPLVCSEIGGDYSNLRKRELNALESINVLDGMTYTSGLVKRMKEAYSSYWDLAGKTRGTIRRFVPHHEDESGGFCETPPDKKKTVFVDMVKENKQHLAEVHLKGRDIKTTKERYEHIVEKDIIEVKTTAHTTVDERVAELAEENRLRGFGTAPLKVWAPEVKVKRVKKGLFSRAGDHIKDRYKAFLGAAAVCITVYGIWMGGAYLHNRPERIAPLSTVKKVYADTDWIGWHTFTTGPYDEIYVKYSDGSKKAIFKTYSRIRKDTVKLSPDKSRIAYAEHVGAFSGGNFYIMGVNDRNPRVVHWVNPKEKGLLETSLYLSWLDQQTLELNIKRWPGNDINYLVHLNPNNTVKNKKKISE